MILSSAGFGYHVVYVDFDFFMHHIMEQGCHGSLISSTGILQAKLHDIICIGSLMCGKYYISFVLLNHFDMVVARETIHEGEEPIGSSMID